MVIRQLNMLTLPKVIVAVPSRPHDLLRDLSNCSAFMPAAVTSTVAHATVTTALLYALFTSSDEYLDQISVRSTDTSSYDEPNL
ncbi:hypothetical protein PF010_g31151 [Phytophthora fragariae]|uniref:Uncharacterized protein n=1 Tax=Phytophthora fragariae TaxID=53985 RepID=A0A6G0Q3G2_9STRA|nr:hypothetical protein PF010_g31151 [Phytophthora fragariae]KAE9268310.1 hypothetical protein PF008_g31154 [Phytophthora fragariae]